MAAMSPWVKEDNFALFTDLYELTMLQAYFEAGMAEEATFSLYCRRLPAGRNYLLACGLEDALNYLENLRFTEENLDYLATLGQFSLRFLDWLKDFRFTGAVDAVLEGTPVFPNEPILEVTAPIAEAQLAETFIMNQINLQTVMASKAVRVVTAAQGRTVVDFAARRMHGTDAAVKAVRAFYIAGVEATSNVLASRIYGVPPSGTMAHSYVEAHDSEMAAFREFAKLYPGTVLLVDTYDTLEGVRRVVRLAREADVEFNISAIRLDSGDLAALAKEARTILDEAGLRDVQIFASSSLDEYAIHDLIAAKAPISGFGVGSKMGVSEDAPGLDLAYKLCSYAGRGRLKLSPGKMILPGRKQVFREEADGCAVRDIIGRADENLPGRPLLVPVMKNGQRLEAGRGTLKAARERARAEVAKLPAAVQAIEPADPPYPTELSVALSNYHDKVKDEVMSKVSGET